ncbi:hypothetical protein D4Q76_02845 [archaeon]|nr:MAG: hypothetical protein D4Q76_02845 [archaeon]
MNYYNNLIVGIGGGVACGKTSIANYLEKKGFEKINTFSILESLAQHIGIIITKREDLREIFLQMEKEGSSKVLMDEVSKRVNPYQNYVVDSIRYSYQDTFLKQNYSKRYKLIFLETPIERRHQENILRGRFIGDKGMAIDYFIKYIEIDGEQGINELRKKADFVLGYHPNIEQRLQELDGYLNRFRF